jgi:hypothetical protein
MREVFELRRECVDGLRVDVLHGWGVQPAGRGQRDADFVRMVSVDLDDSEVEDYGVIELQKIGHSSMTFERALRRMEKSTACIVGILICLCVSVRDIEQRG